MPTTLCRYNEAFALHCLFKDAAKQFSTEARAVCDRLVEKLGGAEQAEACASPLLDLMQRGTSLKGHPVPGLVTFLRDAMEILAYSVVHTYVEYEMDAEERAREINMLKYQIDHLMIECDHIAQIIRRIQPDRIVLLSSVAAGGGSAGAGAGTAAATAGAAAAASANGGGGGPLQQLEQLSAGPFIERSLSSVQRENAVAEELRAHLSQAATRRHNLLTCISEGMKDMAEGADTRLQAQQQLQWAACQKWHAANAMDQWGNPVGTEYPGGSPCRPGSNSTVFADARLAKLRGLDR